MIFASRIISIALIILSLGIGLIAFYLLTDLSKVDRKKYVSELISQLINFILFIWVGKVLLNLSLFIRDPLSVLAYPSNAGAFYLAIVFTTVIVIYQAISKKLELLVFSKAVTHVFLVALFFYEFSQFFLEENRDSFSYLIMSFILLSIFYSLRDRLKTAHLLRTILVISLIGMMVISFIQPYVVIFGYLINRWFIIIFSVVSLFLITYVERKVNS